MMVARGPVSALRVPIRFSRVDWRKIPIALIMALRWALECNALASSITLF
jgi:hypothetical protein